MHPLLQPALPSRKNPCSKSGCDLCVLAPGGGSHCLCPEGYHLDTNEKTCVNRWNVSCQFHCDNGKCFSTNVVCNGKNDCGDGSDERNCNKTCDPDLFQCKNGNCTKKFYVCDGEQDCDDGSDELDCPELCHSFQFRCNNHRCVSRRQRCNGEDNCGDNSDEIGGCTNTSSPCNKKTQFQCTNGKCILRHWTCDGDYDCSDKSDEAPELCKRCKEHFFRCNNSRCILGSYKCDGQDDCGDGSDEDSRACNTTCNPKTQGTCANKQCISKGWFCDGAEDCTDGSDEKNCPEPTCPNEFKCDNGNCISLKWRCDADDDCADNSDEKNCTMRCRNGNFKCGGSSGTCINSKWKCDGEIDCPDMSDEANCTRPITKCTGDDTRCNDGTCIRRDWLCDGSVDCFDGSDESPRQCKIGNDQCDPKIQFQCDSGMCVRRFKRCDGKQDCADGSDEKRCTSECKESGGIHCDGTSGECIPQQKQCDYFPDCSNLVDEKDCKRKWENKTECSKTCGFSECVKNGSMLLCQCPSGYKFNKDRQCVDINECKDTPGVCDQICENKKGSYKCSCKYRYSNSKSERCKLEGPPPVLVIPTSDKVMILPARDTKKHIASYIHVDLPQITSFDMYYGDNSGRPFFVVGDAKHSKQIVVISVNSHIGMTAKRRRRDSEPMHRLEYNISNISPSIIAIDYLGKNIFWVDNDKAPRPGIYIASLKNGKHMRLVLHRVNKIEGFVLNPIEGLMYWCENSIHPIIFQAKMNGEDVKKLVSSKLEFPTGLTIDYPSSRLFWADTKKNSIESVLFNGSLRLTTFDRFRDNTFLHPYSIDVFEDHLYGIIKDSGHLFKVPKFGRGPLTYLKRDIHKTSQLQLHQHNKQLVPEDGFVNPCPHAYCKELCVVIQRNATCLCTRNDQNCGPPKCDSKFCNDNGVCRRTVNGENVCSCDPGYTGTRCTDTCKCRNGGTCKSDGRGAYTCNCPVGYLGEECEDLTCYGRVCGGNGRCVIQNNTVTCQDMVERSTSEVVVIAIPVLAFILIFVIIVLFIAWKRRVSRQFAPKKLRNTEMDNPVYTNRIENDEEHVVMEYDKGFLKGSKFKYFPNKKEKKEKDRFSPRKKFRDSQGDYKNFVNSDDHLNEEFTCNEKALLVCTDDEDLSS